MDRGEPIAQLAGQPVPLPTLTIGDLVDYAAGRAVPAIRERLDTWLDRLSTIVYVTPFTGDLHERIDAARDIVNLVLTPSPFTYAPDVLPTTPLAGFPDIYQAFLGGGRRAELLASVARLGSEAEVGVISSLRAAQGLARGAAMLSAAEGERQARLGAGLNLPERERAGRALAASLFGPLRSEVEARAAATPADPLALAFDAAVAGGGITAAAGAVPAYVGRLRDRWTVRTQATAHPTSAHILARHGYFAGVRVPRLTVRAENHLADADLATATATRFRSVVGRAYLDGRARMAVLQAEATAPRPTATPTPIGGGSSG